MKKVYFMKRRTTTLAAPIISSVTLSQFYGTAAIMTWDTQVLSTSQVEYGPTTSYGSLTTLDPTLSLSHSVQITGLDEESVLHARPRSKNANGVETIGSDATITLLLQLPDIGPTAGLDIVYAADLADITVTEFYSTVSSPVSSPVRVNTMTLEAGTNLYTEDFNMNVWGHKLVCGANSYFLNWGVNGTEGTLAGSGTEIDPYGAAGGTGGIGGGTFGGGGGASTDLSSVSGGAPNNNGEFSQTLEFSFIEGGISNGGIGNETSLSWPAGANSSDANEGTTGHGGAGNGGDAGVGPGSGGGGGGPGGPVSLVFNWIDFSTNVQFVVTGGIGGSGVGTGTSAGNGGEGTTTIYARKKTGSTPTLPANYKLVEIFGVPGDFTEIDHTGTPGATWNNLD